MPLDAICMQAVVRETAAQIENARIEKIQQPARDQVILLLRGGRRLLLNAGASQPRLHLTPPSPPCFVCCCGSIWPGDGYCVWSRSRWSVWWH